MRHPAYWTGSRFEPGASWTVTAFCAARDVATILIVGGALVTLTVVAGAVLAP